MSDTDTPTPLEDDEVTHVLVSNETETPRVIATARKIGPRLFGLTLQPGDDP